MGRGELVLVTGVNGFVGQHAAHDLARHGYRVVGLAREPEPLEGLPLVEYVRADLARPWPALPKVDAILHLAGLSAVGPSFSTPQRYVEVNAAIVNEMAAWVQADAPRSRGIVVSSGAIYDSSRPGALDETAPTAFTSPYVVSKVLVENLVAYYRRRGLEWAVARPFNHIGPGQGPGFLLPDLTAGLIEAGESGGSLRVGDLGTARDYTDVRDVVAAYRLILQAPAREDWVFNVCSGRSRTGKEILNLVAQALGVPLPMTDVDQARIRPDDPREVRGSAARLHALTGWMPAIDLETSVRDYVTHCRGGV